MKKFKLTLTTEDGEVLDSFVVYGKSAIDSCREIASAYAKEAEDCEVVGGNISNASICNRIESEILKAAKK